MSTAEQKEVARIADEMHRKNVINQAVESIIIHGIAEDHAKEFIALIIEGRIKHVTINF